MKKRMEEMSKEEVLKEFEASPVAFRVGKRPNNPSLLTLRVSADLKSRLAEEAKKRGVSGHTTMARLLIEDGLRRSADVGAKRRGKPDAREVLRRLRQDVDAVSRVLASGR